LTIHFLPVGPNKGICGKLAVAADSESAASGFATNPPLFNQTPDSYQFSPPQLFAFVRAQQCPLGVFIFGSTDLYSPAYGDIARFDGSYQSLFTAFKESYDSPDIVRGEVGFLRDFGYFIPSAFQISYFSHQFEIYVLPAGQIFYQTHEVALFLAYADDYSWDALLPQRRVCFQSPLPAHKIVLLAPILLFGYVNRYGPLQAQI
jgi:hypothetical protein